ncbi:MAG: flagellar motor protein MotB [Alphaproteobacteria bacterium]|nr:flagellar motor protein MotB [Alphaproteobacteria bacterium]
MSAADKGDVAPIIIRRIKKHGGSHHGGSWKVAYADFVTAMMAFFLLLWLLSSTSKAQKEAIAEYFTPTVGIKDEQGIGFKGGLTESDEGKKKDDRTPVTIVQGAPTKGPINKTSQEYTESIDQDEGKVFDQAALSFKKQLEEDQELQQFKDNIMIEETPEGLQIQIVDTNRRSMFITGRPELLPHARTILQKVTQIVEPMPNKVTVTGHTDSSKTSTPSYSNWELSADRANASRRFMLESGLLPEKMAKVVGRADQELLDPAHPTSPSNRRITILLMRSDTIRDDHPGLGNLLNAPTVHQPKPNLEIDPKKKKESLGEKIQQGVPPILMPGVQPPALQPQRPQNPMFMQQPDQTSRKLTPQPRVIVVPGQGEPKPGIKNSQDTGPMEIPHLPAAE